MAVKLLGTSQPLPVVDAHINTQPFQFSIFLSWSKGEHETEVTLRIHQYLGHTATLRCFTVYRRVQQFETERTRHHTGRKVEQLQLILIITTPEVTHIYTTFRTVEL
ncbi:hypothetical protein D3C72_1053780 [compost metagenome]